MEWSGVEWNLPRRLVSISVVFAALRPEAGVIRGISSTQQRSAARDACEDDKDTRHVPVKPTTTFVFGRIEQLGKNFNPEAADFNLEGVFSLGLHNLAEFIGDLSTNANKELGIEQVRGDLRTDPRLTPPYRMLARFRRCGILCEVVEFCAKLGRTWTLTYRGGRRDVTCQRVLCTVSYTHLTLPTILLV